MARDAAGGGLDGEAHHRLVDRADLLDVERAVGEPLADLGRRVLDGHQVLQDPQEAAVGDGQHARGVVGGAAAFEEGERVGVEELAAPRADEARGVAGVDQAEERQEPAPAALALLHRVGVEGGVLGELGVEAAERIAALVERAGGAVGPRRHELAVLGVEDEDEAQEDREQAFVEVLGTLAGEAFDQRRLGGVEPAQELVECPQDLLGQRGGDGGLGLAAGLQHGVEALGARRVEEAVAVEGELEARQHRPAGDGRERAQRERQPARGLALGGVDEAQLAVGHEHADEHAGLAQQALEALVRRRLPALLRAVVRFGAGGLEADEQLPGRVGAETLDGEVGREGGVVLGHGNEEVVGQRRPVGRARHVWRRPVEEVAEEGPGIGERGRGVVGLDEGGVGGAVGRGLPCGDEGALLDDRGREDEARGLDVVEPFEVGVAGHRVGHGDHPVFGQR